VELQGPKGLSGSEDNGNDAISGGLVYTVRDVTDTMDSKPSRRRPEQRFPRAGSSGSELHWRHSSFCYG